MLERDGHPVASVYRLSAAQVDAGVPAHWTAYVAVASADETARRAESLGGAVAVPPFDVADLGRMALLQDPSGAWFAAWEAGTHAGSRLLDEAGALGWTGLLADGSTDLVAFYGALFGWTVEEGLKGPGATFRLAGIDRAIAGWHDPGGRWAGPPQWLVHVLVDDLDAAVGACRSLGAEILSEAPDTTPPSRWVVGADPHDALFAMLET